MHTKFILSCFSELVCDSFSGGAQVLECGPLPSLPYREQVLHFSFGSLFKVLRDVHFDLT